MPSIPTFKLEDYMQEWEFAAPYMLCCSDTESWSQKEILDMADAECKDVWDNLRLGYTEVPGLPVLRAEIAKRYPGLSADNILCFAGAEEGIYCVTQALLGPTDHAITVVPCYQSLFECPKHSGAEVTSIELKEEAGWKLDIDEIEAAIRPNTRLIMFNSPHNPTGMFVSDADVERLVSIARARGLYLFHDEVFRLSGPDDSIWHTPTASRYEKGISLGVISKAYGMAGLRVGWIASKDKHVIDAATKYKHYTSICNAAPSEVLTLIALRNADHILNRNNDIIRRNLDLLDAFLLRHKDRFSWVRPRAGCTGFVRSHEGRPVEELARVAALDGGVVILPGSAYSPLYGRFFRLGFGRENMPEGLERLEKLLLTEK